MMMKQPCPRARHFYFAFAVVLGILLPLSWIWLATWMIHSEVIHNNKSSFPRDTIKKRKTLVAPLEDITPTISQQSQCSYRAYPPKRYYGLTQPQPDFLKDAEYIYGKPPMLLQPDHDLGKLCVHQSAWHNSSTLPFSDGANPAILTADYIRARVSHDRPWWSLVYNNQKIAYITIVVFKHEVAFQWGDSEQDIHRYNLSRRTEHEIRGTMVLFLNDQLHTISQARVYMERDASIRPSYKPQRDTSGKSYIKELRFLDDPRLVVHDGQVYLSFCFYITGVLKRQFFAPLHLLRKEKSPNHNDDDTMIWIRASEIIKVCCGRMACSLPCLGSTSKTHVGER
jgi:hypothetical protein